MIHIFCKLCFQSVLATDWKSHTLQKQHLQQLPHKLVVKGSFKQDQIDQIYEYFGKFGGIRSQNVIFEKHEAVIEYRFWDARVYSEVIHQEHVLFDQQVEIGWYKKDKSDPVQYVVQDEKMEKEKFVYRKLAIISSLKDLPTFNDQIKTFENKMLAIKNEMETNRKRIQSDLMNVLSSNFPHNKIHFFGSTITELDIHNSDLNIYLDGTDSEVATLELIKDLITKNKNFRNVSESETSIKFQHKKTHISCELTIKNELPVGKSELIKYYLTLDKKLRDLMLLIKFWSDCHEINDSFSSYALYIMVIFYLQQEPTKLPSVSDLQKDLPSDEIDGWNCAFGPVEFANKILENSTILDLLTGFFRFYANFDYTSLVISPYFGSPIDKTCFLNPQDLPECFQDYKNQNDIFFVNEGICVQDFFEHSKNVSLVRLSSSGKFTAVCRQSQRLMEKKDLYELFCQSLNLTQFCLMKDVSWGDSEWVLTVKGIILRILKEILSFEVEEIKSEEADVVYFCKGEYKMDFSHMTKDSESGKISVVLKFENDSKSIKIDFKDEENFPVLHLQHYIYIMSIKFLTEEKSIKRESFSTIDVDNKNEINIKTDLDEIKMETNQSCVKMEIEDDIILVEEDNENQSSNVIEILDDDISEVQENEIATVSDNIETKKEIVSFSNAESTENRLENLILPEGKSVESLNENISIINFDEMKIEKNASPVGMEIEDDIILVEEENENQSSDVIEILDDDLCEVQEKNQNLGIAHEIEKSVSDNIATKKEMSSISSAESTENGVENCILPVENVNENNSVANRDEIKIENTVGSCNKMEIDDEIILVEDLSENDNQSSTQVEILDDDSSDVQESVEKNMEKISSENVSIVRTKPETISKEFEEFKTEIATITKQEPIFENQISLLFTLLNRDRNNFEKKSWTLIHADVVSVINSRYVVNMFGSYLFYLHTKNSALDIHIDVSDGTESSVIFDLFSKRDEFHDLEFDNEILKCIHRNTQIRCRINLANKSWPGNSRIIKYYVELNMRIMGLFRFVKFWADCHYLNAWYNFSNHAIYLMVVFFLQQPPYSVPPVSKLLEAPSYGSVKFKRTAIRAATIWDLVRDFFKFYGNFDYFTYVISPYSGQIIEKISFIEPYTLSAVFHTYVENNLELQSEPWLCIQDPLDLSKNVGSSISHEASGKFAQMCRRGLTCIENGEKDLLYRLLVPNEISPDFYSFTIKKPDNIEEHKWIKISNQKFSNILKIIFDNETQEGGFQSLKVRGFRPMAMKDLKDKVKELVVYNYWRKNTIFVSTIFDDSVETNIEIRLIFQETPSGMIVIFPNKTKMVLHYVHFIYTRFSFLNEIGVPHINEPKFFYHDNSRVAKEVQIVHLKMLSSRREVETLHKQISQDLSSILAPIFPEMEIHFYNTSDFLGKQPNIYLSNIDLRNVTIESIVDLISRSNKFTKVFLISDREFSITCEHLYTRVSCNLNVKNRLPVRTTDLIRFYSSIDDKVSMLMMIVKMWKDLHEFPLSNDAIFIMVIFFLQCTYNLSSVEDLQEDVPEDLIDGWNCAYEPIETDIFTSVSFFDLVKGFFEFYVTFNSNSYMVCPYLGSLIRKCRFLKPFDLPKCYRNYIDRNEEIILDSTLTVQDPFHHSINLTDSLDWKFMGIFAYCCFLASKKIENGNFLSLLKEKDSSLRFHYVIEKDENIGINEWKEKILTLSLNIMKQLFHTAVNVQKDDDNTILFLFSRFSKFWENRIYAEKMLLLPEEMSDLDRESRIFSVFKELFPFFTPNLFGISVCFDTDLCTANLSPSGTRRLRLQKGSLAHVVYRHLLEALKNNETLENLVKIEEAHSVLESVESGETVETVPTFNGQVFILHEKYQDSDLSHYCALIEDDLKSIICLKKIVFSSKIINFKMKDQTLDIYLECEYTLENLKDSISKSESFSDVTIIPNLLKCKHVKTQTVCDININKFFEETSHLINYYLSLDDKLRTFMTFIRFWFDSYKMIGVYRFSENAMFMMVIFFLQHEPYNLPSLESLQKDASPNLIEGWNCAFSHRQFANPILQNATILDLVVDFFKFYAKFDYISNVISPYFGSAIDKIRFLKPYDLPECYKDYNDQDKELLLDSSICIQDCFEHSRNISCVFPYLPGQFAILCQYSLQSMSDDESKFLNNFISCDHMRFKLYLQEKERLNVKTATHVLETIVTQIFEWKICAVIKKETNATIHCTSQCNIWNNRINCLKKVPDSIVGRFDREVAATKLVIENFPQKTPCQFTVVIESDQKGGITIEFIKNREFHLIFQIMQFIYVNLLEPFPKETEKDKEVMEVGDENNIENVDTKQIEPLPGSISENKNSVTMQAEAALIFQSTDPLFEAKSDNCLDIEENFSVALPEENTIISAEALPVEIDSALATVKPLPQENTTISNSSEVSPVEIDSAFATGKPLPQENTSISNSAQASPVETDSAFATVKPLPQENTTISNSADVSPVEIDSAFATVKPLPQENTSISNSAQASPVETDSAFATVKPLPQENTTISNSADALPVEIGSAFATVKPLPHASTTTNNHAHTSPAATCSALAVESFPQFSEQLKNLRAGLQPNMAERKQKYLSVYEDVNRVMTLAKVLFFGSTLTRLDVKTSDLNLNIESAVPKKTKKCLEFIKELFSKSEKFSNVEIVTSVKMNIATLECVHVTTNTKCEICFRDRLVVRNSELLEYYYDLDEKLRTILIMIHFWVERHNLDKIFSKYALNLMMVFYLQQPPYKLPSVLQLQKKTPPLVIEGWNCSFCKLKLNSTSVLSNASILDLVKGFFKFYADFDCFSFVIAPFFGSAIAKTRFLTPFSLPQGYQAYVSQQKKLEVNKMLCVQDPFEHATNVASSVPNDVAAKFAALCRRAYNLMQRNEEEGMLEVLLERDNFEHISVFEIEKTNELSKLEWKILVKSFVWKILGKILGCCVVQKENSSETTIYECTGHYNVWDNRTSVLKNLLKDLSKNTSSVEKEIAVSTGFIKTNRYSNFWKISLMVTFSENPCKISVSLRGTEQVYYFCHFIYVKLKKFLKETNSETFSNQLANEKIKTIHAASDGIEESAQSAAISPSPDQTMSSGVTPTVASDASSKSLATTPSSISSVTSESAAVSSEVGQISISASSAILPTTSLFPSVTSEETFSTQNAAGESEVASSGTNQKIISIPSASLIVKSETSSAESAEISSNADQTTTSVVTQSVASNASEETSYASSELLATSFSSVSSVTSESAAVSSKTDHIFISTPSVTSAEAFSTPKASKENQQNISSVILTPPSISSSPEVASFSDHAKAIASRKLAFLDETAEKRYFNDQLSYYAEKHLIGQEKIEEYKRMIHDDLCKLLTCDFTFDKISFIGSFFFSLFTEEDVIEIYIDNLKSRSGIIGSIYDVIKRSDEFIEVRCVLKRKIGTLVTTTIHCTHKKTKRRCKILFQDKLVLYSLLTHHYLKFDAKLYLFFFFIKCWAELYDLRLAKFAMTNYCLYLMAIFYLQQEPYKLPSVADLQKNVDPYFVSGWNCAFGPVEFTSSALENSTVLDLITGFFKFYGNFDYFSNVIAPFSGLVMDKTRFLRPFHLPEMYTNYINQVRILDVDKTFCIQDVFDHSLNLSSVVRPKTLGKFAALCRVAVHLISLGETSLLRELFTFDYLKGKVAFQSFEIARSSCCPFEPAQWHGMITELISVILTHVLCCNISVKKLSGKPKKWLYRCTKKVEILSAQRTQILKGLLPTINPSASLIDKDVVVSRFFMSNLKNNAQGMLRVEVIMRPESVGVRLLRDRDMFVTHFIYTRMLSAEIVAKEQVAEGQAASGLNSLLSGFPSQVASIKSEETFHTQNAAEVASSKTDQQTISSIAHVKSEASFAESAEVCSNAYQTTPSVVTPSVSSNASEKTLSASSEFLATPLSSVISESAAVSSEVGQTSISASSAILLTTPSVPNEEASVFSFTFPPPSISSSQEVACSSDELEAIASTSSSSASRNVTKFALLEETVGKKYFADQLSYYAKKLLVHQEKIEEYNRIIHDDLCKVLNAHFTFDRIFFIGSVFIGLFTEEDEIDIYIDNLKSRPNFMESIEDVLKKCEEFIEVGCFLRKNETRKGVTVKCRHRRTERRCEIHFQDKLVLYSSLLIHYYLTLDPKLHLFMFFMKSWSKFNHMNTAKFDGPTAAKFYVTNYCLYLMVIFYLQQEPCKLPSVADLQKNVHPYFVNGWNCAFGPVEFTSPTLKNSTVLDLINGFFKFYGSFDYFSNVIAPFSGLVIDKTRFLKAYNLPELYTTYIRQDNTLLVDTEICIQDVFDHSLNLSSAGKSHFVGIFAGLCRGGVRLISSGENSLLRRLFTDCRLYGTKYFDNFEIAISPSCPFEPDQWLQTIKDLIVVILTQILCCDIMEIDKGPFEKMSENEESWLYTCMLKKNIFYEPRAEILKRLLPMVHPHASLIDKDVLVSRYIMSSPTISLKAGGLVMRVLMRPESVTVSILKGNPNKTFINHFVYTRMLSVGIVAPVGETEATGGSNSLLSGFCKPYKVKVVLRGVFSGESLILVHDYFLKFGAIINYNVTQENEKCSIEYCFADPVVYLQVITQEHTLFYQKLRIIPLALVKEKISNVNFANFRLSVIHKVAQLSNFDSQMDILKKEFESKKNEIEQNRKIIQDDLNSILLLSLTRQVNISSNIFTPDIENESLDFYIDKESIQIASLEAVKRFISVSKFSNVFLTSQNGKTSIRCKHIKTQRFCHIKIGLKSEMVIDKLLKYYLSLDPKLEVFMMMVKFWADSYDLIGEDSFSTYAILLMVIFYIQQEFKLPSVKNLQENISEDLENGWNYSFSEIIECEDSAIKRASFFDLVSGFFKFYSKFDYITYVVSPYFGGTIEKTSFLKPFDLPECFKRFENLNQDLSLSTGLCLQDVFDHSRNVTETVSLESIGRFTSLCRSAIHFINEGEPFLLHRLFLHCQNEILVQFPSFVIEKPQEREEAGWIQSVKMFTLRILFDVLHYKLSQIADFNILRINYVCVGQKDVWTNRISFTKCLSSQLAALGEFEKEAAITKAVLDFSQKPPWNVVVELTFVKDPCRVKIMITNKGGCFDVYHTCHFVYTRLMKFLENEQKTKNASTSSARQEDSSIVKSGVEPEKGTVAADQVTASSQSDNLTKEVKASTSGSAEVAVPLAKDDDGARPKTESEDKPNDSKNSQHVEEGEITNEEDEEEDDVPSDFFDDFAREDFLEGLDIVDAWDDDSKVSDQKERKNDRDKKKRSKSRSRTPKRRRSDSSRRRSRSRSRDNDRKKRERRSRSRSRRRSASSKSDTKRRRSRSPEESRRRKADSGYRRRRRYSRSSSGSRSPPRKTRRYEEVKKRKSFLEEIKEKLDEMAKPSTPSTSTIGNWSTCANTTVPIHLPVPFPAATDIPLPPPLVPVLPQPLPPGDFCVGIAPPGVSPLGMPFPVPFPSVNYCPPEAQPYPQNHFFGEPVPPVPPVAVEAPQVPTELPNLETRPVSVSSSMDLETPPEVQEDNSPAKLFAERKISLCDFLSLSAKKDETPEEEHLRKRTKVLSRCQDILDVMAPEPQIDRLIIKKSLPETQRAKYESPLKSAIVRFTFTTPPPKLAEDAFTEAINKILRVAEVFKEVQTGIVGDFVETVTEKLADKVGADKKTVIKVLWETLVGDNYHEQVNVGTQCLPAGQSFDVGLQVKEEDLGSRRREKEGKRRATSSRDRRRY